MQKYIIIFLFAALSTLSWLHKRTRDDLINTSKNLSIAIETNNDNVKILKELQEKIKVTDEVIEQWQAEHQKILKERNSARKAIKEALKDDNFKDWASDTVPSDAWRLLQGAKAPLKD